MPAATVEALARPSGALAMLAVDQREALRVMMADARDAAPTEVSDEELTEFKVTATEVLSPYASAVLVDHQFGWSEVVRRGVTAPTCALISSADHFVPSVDELVADAVIDPALDFAAAREQGASAVKLLVIWRQEGDPEARRAMVREFVDRSQQAGLVSIIEPVTRAPRDGSTWDKDEDVVAAAVELGALGADVYKAEVPTLGQGSDADMDRYGRRITEAVEGRPWVVLSSGVPAELFPHAVEVTCRAGARGFLSGRAVWASSLGAKDLAAELRAVGVPRLQRLSQVVDDIVGG